MPSRQVSGYNRSYSITLILMTIAAIRKNTMVAMTTARSAPKAAGVNSPVTSARIRFTAGVNGKNGLILPTIAGKLSNGKKAPEKKVIGAIKRVK